MARTNPSQLPPLDEFRRQVEGVSPRPPLPEQVGRHYADFAAAMNLFAAYGVETDVFTRPFTREECLARLHLDHGETAMEELLPRMLAAEPSPAQRAACDAYFDYLAEEDPLVRADAIFVFGGIKPYRAERAIPLFLQGYAPLLVFTGRSPMYQESEPEAERDRRSAIARGVPEDAIVAETESRTMLDNVRCALNALDARGIAPSAWITVAAPYCQRRGWAYLKKHLPLEARIVRVNAATEPEYGRDVWFRHERSVRILVNESMKLRSTELFDLS